MLAIVLALGAAVAWGTADFVGGLKTRSVPVLHVGLVSQGAGLAIVVVLVVAAGLPGVSATVLALGAAAGAANVVGIVAFYRGLATGRMSVVAPIVGMSAALPVAVGIASGETLSAPQAAGVVVAVAGIVLTSRELDADAGAASLRPAVMLAVVAALGIGANLVLLERAIDDRPASALLWALAAGRGTTFLIVGAVLAVRGRGRVVISAPLAPLVALGAIDLAANLLYGAAARESLLALAAVLASLHPVVTVLLARALLDERLRAVQQAGVALAVAGVALIGL